MQTLSWALMLLGPSLDQSQVRVSLAPLLGSVADSIRFGYSIGVVNGKRTDGGVVTSAICSYVHVPLYIRAAYSWYLVARLPY